MVLPCPMPDVFGIGWVWVGKGNSPVLALGLGTMLPRGESLPLGVQRAQLGAQGVKWGEKGENGLQNGVLNTTSHHQNPISSSSSPRWHDPSSPP